MSATAFYLIKSKNISSRTNEKWTINFYQGFEDYLFSNKLDDKLLDIISYIEDSKYQLPFRYNLEIKTVQFLLGIIPVDNSIYIGTKNLSLELTLAAEQAGANYLIHEHAQRIATIPLENTPPEIYIITQKYQLSDFSKDEFVAVHGHAHKLSVELVKKVNVYNQTLFEKISDFGLDLTANYMLIRIHLLKFLAILPSLDHDKNGYEVKRIFLESMIRLVSDSKTSSEKKLKGQQRGLPYQYTLAIKCLIFIAKVIPAKLLASTIRFSVALMAKRFIAGENIKLAQKTLKKLIDSNRDATLDQLGELVVSNKEADEYENKVIEIINGFDGYIIPGSKNKAGINQAHVSIKVSALSNDFRPYAFNQTYEKVAPRLKRILVAAKEKKVFINIDAEHYHYRDIVLAIYDKVLLDTPELHDYKDTGIVIQAYLRDGHKHFFDVLDLAKKRSVLMPIRLVKGAYWDVETVEADAHNFDAPEFLNKEETDIHFRQLVCLALKNSEYVHLSIASHNIQDHCFAEAARAKLYPNAPIIEHQCLHMTYEALSVGLSLMDWPTRNYIPIGNLLVGMAYLVRRIMENSSQVGILTIMRSHKKTMSTDTPNEILDDKFIKKQISYDKSISEVTKRFKNIYPIRSYKSDHFSHINQKINTILSNVQNSNLLITNGDIEHVSSSDPKLILAKISENSQQDVDLKIKNLFKGFMQDEWKNNDLLRYEKLLNLSDQLLLNREELTAIITIEAGKTLDEAIADVDEAIDFIQFYVKEHAHIKSKNNDYEAKGVFGIIAPWNFPLAIPVGMTTAALACGNTVILKPAEQTPIIALKLLELARLAGIEADILDIAIGEGAIGKSIVDHELINGIIFTGSKAVGSQIYRNIKTQLTHNSYPFTSIPKTAITEMGGKNAIIVTNNCELDETVAGVIYSAFAHSGQKCSAASRIIIDRQIKDSFVSRFIDAVKDLKVGKSYNFDTVINPLISSEDQKRVINMTIKAKEEAEKYGGKVLLNEADKNYPGFCVGPSVFELPLKRALSKESISQQEIFGPMVHIIAYDHIEEAIELFNGTDYALTGGIFCQSQDDIDYFVPKLEAGNLYINRPNTGARVAIEPFGGFKLSGTGPKAGCRDYLYSFMHIPAYNIIENTQLSVAQDLTNKFISTKASKVSWRSRSEKLVLLIDEIIANYEVYFQNINEKDKESLIDFKHFIKNPANNLDIKEYPNRKIPGQISYTQRNMGMSKGAFILSNNDISLSTFVEVLTNSFIGNGVNIFCCNDIVYKRWKNIIKLIYKTGFSAYNISVIPIEKNNLLSLIYQQSYQFIVLDYNLDLYQQVSKSILDRDENFLPKFYISNIEFEMGNWEDYIAKFTHARSFAINTMRHGAPLEVDLN